MIDLLLALLVIEWTNEYYATYLLLISFSILYSILNDLTFLADFLVVRKVFSITGRAVFTSNLLFSTYFEDLQIITLSMLFEPCYPSKQSAYYSRQFSTFYFRS